MSSNLLIIEKRKEGEWRIFTCLVFCFIVEFTRSHLKSKCFDVVRNFRVRIINFEEEYRIVFR